MDANPLADIVPLARLPEIAPHLCDKHRVAYWLRQRTRNGSQAAGAIWIRDGIAYCSLTKLGAWLTEPTRLLPKVRR